MPAPTNKHLTRGTNRLSHLFDEETAATSDLQNDFASGRCQILKGCGTPGPIVGGARSSLFDLREFARIPHTPTR